MKFKLTYLQLPRSAITRINYPILRQYDKLNPEYNELLYIFIRRNDLKMVDTILSLRVINNNKLQYNLLDIAIYNDSFEMVKLLHKKLTLSIEMYNSAFITSIICQKKKIAMWIFNLRSENIFIDINYNYNMAFIKAAAQGDIEFLEWLLSLKSIGIFVNQSNNNQAFFEAAINQKMDCMKYLLSLNNRGYSIDLSHNNSAILKYMIFFNHIHMVKFLLQLGIAIPLNITTENKEILQLIEKEQKIRNKEIINPQLLSTLTNINLPLGIGEMIYLRLHNSYNIEFQNEYKKMIFASKKRFDATKS